MCFAYQSRLLSLSLLAILGNSTNMKTKLKIIGLIFILISHIASGQRIGSDEIDNSKVTPWMPKLTIEYQYVYQTQ